MFFFTLIQVCISAKKATCDERQTRVCVCALGGFSLALSHKLDDIKAFSGTRALASSSPLSERSSSSCAELIIIFQIVVQVGELDRRSVVVHLPVAFSMRTCNTHTRRANQSLAPRDEWNNLCLSFFLLQQSLNDSNSQQITATFQQQQPKP